MGCPLDNIQACAPLPLEVAEHATTVSSGGAEQEGNSGKDRVQHGLRVDLDGLELLQLEGQWTATAQRPRAEAPGRLGQKAFTAAPDSTAQLPRLLDLASRNGTTRAGPCPGRLSTTKSRESSGSDLAARLRRPGRFQRVVRQPSTCRKGRGLNDLAGTARLDLLMRRSGFTSFACSAWTGEILGKRGLTRAGARWPGPVRRALHDITRRSRRRWVLRGKELRCEHSGGRGEPRLNAMNGRVKGRLSFEVVSLREETLGCRTASS